ncbi:hypothetical protein [Leucobacter sp. GX24907]
MTYRYLVQRFGSNEWLHLNLPLKSDGPDFVHTTYEQLTGTLANGIARSIADDGRRLLESWGTWIHVETESERVWTGIVDGVHGEGAELTVSAREWQGYLHDLIFTGNLWGEVADPAALARSLWGHVQSHKRGALGVTVTGSTPVRVGSKSETAMLTAKASRDSAKKTYDGAAKPRKALEAQIKRLSAPHDKAIKAMEKARQPIQRQHALLIRQRRDDPTLKSLKATYDNLRKNKASSTAIANAKTAYDNRRTYWANRIDPVKAQLEPHDVAIRTRRETRDDMLLPYKDDLAVLKEAEEPVRAAFDAAEERYRTAQEKVREDGGAYKVLAADYPDSWRALMDLAQSTPFEFTTRTERTHGAPKLTLEIQYPRVGRGRDDLIFESGRNIVGRPRVTIPEEYASEVLGSGAGEGEKSLTANAVVDDPRMYRNTLFSDPSITSKSVLQAATRAELKRLRRALLVPELVVREHPNAAIGAWAAGDTITIRLRQVPHFGSVTVKHRIVSWQRVGTGKARLRLEPHV